MMPGQFPFLYLEIISIGNVFKTPEDSAESVDAGGVADGFEVCQDCAGSGDLAEHINRKTVLVCEGAGKEDGADVDRVGETAGDLLF